MCTLWPSFPMVVHPELLEINTFDCRSVTPDPAEKLGCVHVSPKLSYCHNVFHQLGLVSIFFSIIVFPGLVFVCCESMKQCKCFNFSTWKQHWLLHSLNECDWSFFWCVLIWLGEGMPGYLLKHYSGCFFGGVFGWNSHWYRWTE